MSDRSDLRAAALERAGNQCEWPGGRHEGMLEMAHLQQLSQGGPDELENVMILCKYHHDLLDNRTLWKRRDAIVELLAAYRRLDQASFGAEVGETDIEVEVTSAGRIFMGDEVDREGKPV